MINGTETRESLWQHRRAAGDEVTYYEMVIEFVTIDTYEEFFAWVRQKSGL
jgi:hypothetical protein